MSAPFEVIAQPLNVWVAAVGTSFPTVDDAPDGDWFLLGTSGDKNYGDSGVVVTPNQTITPWTPAGATMPRKVWRTAEGFTLGFELVDLTAAQVAKALNDASVDQVAASSGVAGTNTVALYQGIEVAVFALVARGLSAIDDSLAAQFEVYSCYQSASPAITYNKGTPAGLQLQFDALYDEDNSGTGNYVEQSAVAL